MRKGLPVNGGRLIRRLQKRCRYILRMPPKNQSTLTLGSNDLLKMEERLLSAINGAKDELKKEIESVRASLAATRVEFTAELQGLNSKIETDIEDLKKETQEEINKVREDVERLEYHQRKYNLLFFGLKAKRGEEEQALRTMLKDKMAIDLHEYALVNVHAVGQKDSNMIARFARWADRQRVLQSSNKLKGTGIGVSTDLPDRLHAKRSILLKKRKDLKAEGKVVRLIERKRDIFLQIKEIEGGVWQNVD